MIANETRTSVVNDPLEMIRLLRAVEGMEIRFNLGHRELAFTCKEWNELLDWAHAGYRYGAGGKA